MGENVNIAVFIESIRLKRNISKVDLIHGVCSYRQYYRYQRGESVIPHSSMILFARNLKVRLRDLYIKFEDYTDRNKNVILKMFSTLDDSNLKKTYLEAKSLKGKQDLGTLNLDLLEILICLIEFKMGILTEARSVDQIKIFIDYDQCKDRELLNIAEINGMLSILSISQNKEIRSDVLNILLNILECSIIYGDLGDVSVIYSNIILEFGKYNMDEEATLLINEAISKLGSIKEIKALTNIIYYKALLVDDSNKVEAIRLASIALGLVNLTGNKNREKNFGNHFSRQFNI